MTLRKIIFDLLYYSGFGYLLFIINKLNKKTPIILFHRVTPETNPCWSPMHPIIFEKTINLLSKYYQFCTLDDFLNDKNEKKKNNCCIVFDDGYYDFKQYALPILAKYKAPVTLFVPTESMSTDKIWTSEVDAIILQSEESKDGSSIEIDGKKVILKLKTEKELFSTASKVKNLLMRHDSDKRAILIEKIKKEITDAPLQIPKMLSWKDIAEIKQQHPELINIQSHTHTHSFLPSFNKNFISKEMDLSKDILNREDFNSINKIAYPMGGFNSDTIAIAKKYYPYGFITGDRGAEKLKVKNEQDYKYQIPRYNISDNSAPEIFLRINGFHNLLR